METKAVPRAGVEIVVVRSKIKCRQLQHACRLQKVCMLIRSIRYREDEDNWGVTTRQIFGIVDIKTSSFEDTGTQEQRKKTLSK
jgi:hypothetical protein